MYEFKDNIYSKTYRFIFDAIQLLKMHKPSQEEIIEAETILGHYGDENETKIWKESSDIRGGKDGNS